MKKKIAQREKSRHFLYILQELVRYISVMTQKEFTYIADELRYDLLAGN